MNPDPNILPRRALLCGLSTRAIALFIESLDHDPDVQQRLSIVGVIEPDKVRMAAFREKYRLEIPEYSPEDWEKAVGETCPDVLIVATPDYLHAEYILRGLEAGLDVITEKPMVISSEEALRVIEAERQSSGRIWVTFNYRYNPLNQRLREFLLEGHLGRVIQIDFNYCLDTLHGASYFYRWNRRRQLSGSLAIHKCCHYFDLLQWFIGQECLSVTALGGLDYYGATSKHRPGGEFGNTECPYLGKWFKADGASHEDDHPIYHLQGELGLPFSLQYPNRLSIYDEEIDIEDNYSALVQFDQGARMTFSVNFSCPWEGFNLAINGEKGRLEVRYYSSPKRCPFPAVSSANFFPLFGEPIALEWPTVEGGHGGADPQMLRDLLDPNSKTLPTSRDGLLAVAAGEAMWRSALEKRTIFIPELTRPDDAG